MSDSAGRKTSGQSDGAGLVLQAIATGAKAHADCARRAAQWLDGAAKGKAPGVTLKDGAKLRALAASYGISADGRPETAVALDLAKAALDEIFNSSAPPRFLSHAPPARRAIWEKAGLVPEGIDHEIDRALALAGTEASDEAFLVAAARVALADGYGASPLAVALQDILHGTPFPEPGGMDLVMRDAIEPIDSRNQSAEAPESSARAVVGFGDESIQYVLGGRFRACYQPLIDAILSGRVRGVAAVVGCAGSGGADDAGHAALATELVGRDILVLTSGSAQIDCGQAGLLAPEAKVRAGPGLAEVCEAVGIPPVVALGSCIENSRILVICNELLKQAGLEDFAQLPVAGAYVGPVNARVASVGQYFVGSGVLVVVARKHFPIAPGTPVGNFLFSEIAKLLGGAWAVADDIPGAARRIAGHIEAKRDALGINKEQQRKLYGMEDRQKL